MQKILIIEDDEKLREEVRNIFKQKWIYSNKLKKI